MPERWSSLAEIATDLSVYPDTIYIWITWQSGPAHMPGRLGKFYSSKTNGWGMEIFPVDESGAEAVNPAKETFMTTA